MTFDQLYRLVLESTIDWDRIKWKYSHLENDNCHRIDMFNDTGAVGFIMWDVDDGTVERIYIGDKLRRKGLGTHLWEIATDFSEENGHVAPEHSSRRSYEGDAFARSLGGYMPPLKDDIDGWSSR